MNRPFRKLVLAPVSIGCALFLQGVYAQTTSDLGVVRIVGQGEIGNGLMIDEDGVKNRSTITRDAMEKERPSANPFQLLNLMPGVNASSYDATGLFGGNLRVRGFNSDQMGFTVNGAPVNDSGNFAVYPQEYTDTENMCEIFVTQGSADTEAPHVGASGGNVGMVSCGPKDTFGGKVAQSLGQLNFNRTFIRVDTGLFGKDNPSKAFVSYSKSKVDKFKGYGGADREHVDLGWETRFDKDTQLTASLLYNRAVNNNFLTVTKNEFAANPGLDFTNAVPQHAPVGTSDSGTSYFGTSSAGSTPRTKTAYYGYSLNPFENALFTSTLKRRVNERLTLSAEPYYWYGYGTGGTQQTTLSEAASSSVSTALKLGIADINKNGSYGETVGLYRGSVTETHRPGMTIKGTYDVDNHNILFGYWFERANHRQTAPATTVDNNGNIGDLWLKNNLLAYNNGELYQNRNWKTISSASSLFISDTITVDRWSFVPALRMISVDRDFTNYASSGSSSGADYQVKKTYSKTLPSMGFRYKLDDQTQLFGNITQNYRAPSNFVLSGWVSSVTYSGGNVASATITPNNSIQAETSTTTEVGVRWERDTYKASAAMFQVDFQNRIARGFNPDTASYTDFNVGKSKIQGFEMQIGTKPLHGWSYFGSLTYTDSKILQDFPATSSTYLPTNGKQFPDTPHLMAAASVQYTQGPWLAMLSAKHTGKRYTTLVNDEDLGSVTVFDFNAGYRFESSSMFKNPSLRLNISNLFNKSYLNANSGSGSNITTSVAASSAQGGGYPTYYVAPPRFTSLTFTADF